MLAEKADELASWIEPAKSFGIPEIDRFVVRLIKRSMFGRCSFNMLRAKTLALEYKNIT